MRLAALAAVILAGPTLALAQPITFVSTPASDSLAVIDLEANTVVTSVPLSGVPTGCAVGRSGGRAYATLTESNALAIINTSTGALQMVPVGAGPSAVAVAARRAYVANTAADTLSVVDVRSATVVATLPVGDAPLALVIGGNRAFVANSGDGTVSAIDTRTNSVVATIPVGTFPAGLALHAQTRRLYVANFLDDTVSVIHTDTLSVLSTIPVVSRPRGLAVDAAGRRLFVAGFDDGRVQIVDAGTGTATLEAPSGGLNPVDLMLGPRGRLYVAHLQETDGVAVLDGTTLVPVTTVAVPAGPLVFSGMPQRRARRGLATAWQSAPRAALSASLRAVAAMAVPARPARSPSLNGEVIIADEDFHTADWAVSGLAEHETTQVTAGGNPGAWRRTIHYALASESETVHRLVRPGSAYDPAALGAITSIDVSWDRGNLTDSLTTEGFLVEQAGVIYRTEPRAFFSPIWRPESYLGLTADAFDNGSGGHPDFGAAGSPLRFGYFRRTQPNRTVEHGIDNFLVTVYTTPAEGGTLGFAKTIDWTREHDAPLLFVQRRNGTQGAVGVDVLVERPDGTSEQVTLSWGDGDGRDIPFLVLFLDLPSGSGARTARLTLLNPTGGASISAARGKMAITVIPHQWAPELEALYLRMQALLGAFSPAWLMGLAVPSALLAVRRARTR